MLKHALVVAVAMTAVPAVAMDLSFLTGVYQSEEQKVAGEKGGKKSAIDVGGRVSDQLDTNMVWIGQGGLELKSYSAPKNGKAPSNSTSLSAGGGMRYYFGKWSEAATPYLQSIAQYKNQKDATMNGAAGYTESETSGLFYGADLGVRFGLDMDFFVDFEAQLFESALFATEESVSYDTATDTKTETETTSIALHGSSTGAFSSLVIALGMKI
jgi:hypothetical protein